jgi:hypothetical protein
MTHSRRGVKIYQLCVSALIKSDKMTQKNDRLFAWFLTWKAIYYIIFVFSIRFVVRQCETVSWCPCCLATIFFYEYIKSAIRRITLGKP